MKPVNFSNRFSGLMHCSGLLEPPDPRERDRLQAKADKIVASAAARMMWLADTPAAALKEVCEALKRSIEDPQ